MSVVELGSAFRRPPPAEPDPQETVLREVLMAIAGLREALANLPAPRVKVDAPDLGAIVSAVVGLKPGPTADDIAEAVTRALGVMPTPAAAGSDPRLAKALEDIGHRLTGIGNQVYGGGQVSIPADARFGINNFPADQLVHATNLDIAISALRDAVTGGATGTLEAVRSLLAGAATETTLAALLDEFRNKYDVVSTQKATYTTSGDHNLIVPASGKSLRVTWLFGQAKGVLDTGTVGVTFTLGGRSYEIELTGSQSFAHSAVWEGAADQPLVVNTTSTAAVLVNADYREF